MKKSLALYLKMIGSSKIYLVLFGVFYLIGIVLGLFFSPIAQRLVLGESVVGFYVNALSASGRVGMLVISIVLSDVFFLLIFYLCSFGYFAIVIDFALVFYRGYILSCVSFIFLKVFGVSGAFLYVLCVLIHNVIVTGALSVFASIVAKLLKCGKKRADKLRNDLIVVSAAAAFAAVIIEAFFLVFILRPINSTF